jgi:hypothetical protein
MRRGLFAAAVLGCGATHAGERCPPAKFGPVERMLAEPVELQLAIVDGFAPVTSCDGKGAGVILVKVDQKAWCEVSIECTTTIRAPPRSFACDGPSVEAGAHDLGVEVVGRPASLTRRTLSLPAFEKAQGGLVVGAHVQVWVSDERIVIDPPTTMRQSGL